MKPRVIQWATGGMGRIILRALIDHPGVELAGVFVYDPAKVGRDAGDFARRDPTGVLATDDRQEILDMEADVVVHAGRVGEPGDHDDDIAALLRSGKNVISINGYSFPGAWAEERRSRLEVLQTLASRLGISLDELTTDHELHPAGRDIDLPAGTVEKGTVSHVTWRWVGRETGRDRLTMAINWFCDHENLAGPNPPFWEIEIRGHPGVRVAVDLEKHDLDQSGAGAEQYALAAQVINTLGPVIDAEPGIAMRPVATPLKQTRGWVSSC